MNDLNRWQGIGRLGRRRLAGLPYTRAVLAAMALILRAVGLTTRSGSGGSSHE